MAYHALDVQARHAPCGPVPLEAQEPVGDPRRKGEIDCFPHVISGVEAS
eukprot:CAMPEP_0173413464 /NCGR_PEP_ID=MMETSP1356-20130122/82105_1 /TAXON_ID=77927 ORGANISM="Hemiselmis virescens, Strain PCC157" /NCGR_SAMPLE_ID=MMETSP1356 /ASSEMBLY_ACC=CAM_ASM_000847 /LENGTH=48 /DNA_ID= /DNA_START= /DNA_END= /DNA_ORIENTATION=